MGQGRGCEREWGREGSLGKFLKGLGDAAQSERKESIVAPIGGGTASSSSISSKENRVEFTYIGVEAGFGRAGFLYRHFIFKSQ